MRTAAIACVALLGVCQTLNAQQEPNPSVRSASRSMSKVADDVFVITHPDAPNGFPQGNTTVVIGRQSVLIVDSNYLPSAASEDIALIAKLTKKPVRYLVNTHWHFDHTYGNGVYAAAFPGIQIIAHHETSIQLAGWKADWLREFPIRTNAIRSQVMSGNASDGRPLADSALARLRKQLEIRDKIWSEFANYEITQPTLELQSELAIDLGGRTAEVKYLGRGNTTGDLVVFIPDAKVVATGDLLAFPVPYLAGGHPGELVRTLRRIRALGATVAVPGHGAVQHDMTYLESVATFVQEVVTVVDREFFRLGTSWTNVEKMQEAVTAAIDLPKWRQYFTHGLPENVAFFDGYSYPELIKAAFAVAWGR